MPSFKDSKIQFHFLVDSFVLGNRSILKVFISNTLRSHGRKLGNLTFIFCTDKYLLDINKKFLSHNYYTDIITFDLSDTKELEAEIYISIDRVRDNAHQWGKTFKEELHRVIFHGVLHLCGFNDKSLRQQREMRIREDELLKKYFNS